MKKFLLLPVVLAVGLAILIFINAEPVNKAQEGDVFEDSGGDYVTTESGVKYKDLKLGDGKEVKPHDRVIMHYTGWLKDGKKFQSSRDSGQPLDYPLDDLIKGWQEGIPGMKVGGRRRLVIPAELGYGSQNKPGIPPNSELTFVVELLDVK